ncbi:MAG: class I SAM-dependent methyltransferase [bacterium]
MEMRTPQTLDELRERFDAIAGEYGARWDVEEANRLEIAPIMREIAGGILEIGCGNGRFIEKFFDPQRQVVTGVDFSLNMLRAAAERLKSAQGRIFLVQAEGTALPFGDESFDAVACINTIHSIPDGDAAAGVLREAARVLKGGGHLVLEFRNRFNPARRIIERRQIMFLPQKTYSFFEIARVLRREGLGVKRVVPLPVRSFTIHRGRILYVRFRRLVSSLNYLFQSRRMFAPCVCVVFVKRAKTAAIPVIHS